MVSFGTEVVMHTIKLGKKIGKTIRKKILWFILKES